MGLVFNDYPFADVYWYTCSQISSGRGDGIAIQLTILQGGLQPPLGQFMGGIRDITKEELDKLCAEVIGDMNNFESAIIQSQEAYNNLKRNAQDVDTRTGSGGLLKDALLAALGAIPGVAGTVGTAGGVVVNTVDNEWSSFLENLGWGGASVGGSAAGTAIDDKIGGVIGSLVDSLAQLGWKQNELNALKDRLEKSLYDAQLYLQFLVQLRQKIDKYKRMNEIKHEIIFANAHSSRSFSLYSHGANTALWTLDMTLKRTSESPGIEGTYTGDFKILVQYVMQGFLSNPREVYNKANGKVLDRINGTLALWNSPWYGNCTTPNYFGSNRGVAEIERTIIGKATATIDEHGRVDFKFEQNDDLKATNIRNLGFSVIISANAPELSKFGEYYEAHGDYAFMSNYSGPDNPPIRMVVQSETQYWIRLNIDAKLDKQEQCFITPWGTNNKEWLKEFEFDEEVWRPWDRANPPTELRILDSYGW